MELSKSDFEHLLQLRTGLRRFLRWSEQQAVDAGLTPAQHQLLLAIAGHQNPAGPTIGDIADHLVLRHHSASELIDRAAAAGLVRRRPDARNGSVVRVTATNAGSAKLDALAAAHVRELAHLAPTIRTLWEEFERSGPDHAPPSGAATGDRP